MGDGLRHQLHDEDGVVLARGLAISTRRGLALSSYLSLPLCHECDPSGHRRRAMTGGTGPESVSSVHVSKLVCTECHNDPLRRGIAKAADAYTLTFIEWRWANEDG